MLVQWVGHSWHPLYLPLAPLLTVSVCFFTALTFEGDFHVHFMRDKASYLECGKVLEASLTRLAVLCHSCGSLGELRKKYREDQVRVSLPASLIACSTFWHCSLSVPVKFSDSSYLLTGSSCMLTVSFWLQDILALLTREEVVRQLTGHHQHVCNYIQSRSYFPCLTWGGLSNSWCLLAQ